MNAAILYLILQFFLLHIFMQLFYVHAEINFTSPFNLHIHSKESLNNS